MIRESFAVGLELAIGYGMHLERVFVDRVLKHPFGDEHMVNLASVHARCRVAIVLRPKSGKPAPSK
jgi:hypothetical protein